MHIDTKLYDEIMNLIGNSIKESLDFDDNEDDSIIDSNNIQSALIDSIEIGDLLYAKNGKLDFTAGEPIAVCCATASMMEDHQPRYISASDVYPDESVLQKGAHNNFGNVPVAWVYSDPHQYLVYDKPIYDINYYCGIDDIRINGKESTELLCSYTGGKYDEYFIAAKAANEYMSNLLVNESDAHRFYLPAKDEFNIAFAGADDDDLIEIIYQVKHLNKTRKKEYHYLRGKYWTSTLNAMQRGKPSASLLPYLYNFNDKKIMYPDGEIMYLSRDFTRLPVRPMIQPFL